MKQFFMFMALAAAALVFISCTSLLPARIENFVDKVEKNAPSYSEEDWDKVSDQFTKLMDRYEKVYNKLSKEDRARIDKAVGRYHAIVLKSGVNNIVNSFDKAVQGVLKGVGGFFEGLGGKSKEPGSGAKTE